MAEVKTSLTAQFANQANSRGGTLSLSGIAYPVGVGSISVKLIDNIPGPGLRLFSTFGEVRIFSSDTEIIREKIEVVQNSQSWETPFNESIRVILAVNAQGEDINPVLTSTGQRVTSDVPFFGLIARGQYVQPYLILRYTPTVAPVVGGVSVTYGTVAAYKNGNVATYDPQPFGIPDTTDLEVYRIISRSIVNEAGEWEYPNGWPDNPSYPNGATPTPEANSGVVVNRVHEIAMINEFNAIYTRNYPIFPKQPYQLFRNYRFNLTVQEGALESMTPVQRSRAIDAIAARRARGFSYGNAV